MVPCNLLARVGHMESWPLALPCGQQVAILGGRLKAEVRREKKKEVSKQIGHGEKDIACICGF